MTTLEQATPYWESAVWLGLVGIGSGMFNSPNTAAMMGTVAPHRRGVAAGVRMMLQNTGAILSIAFVMAVVTAAVPNEVLFKISRGSRAGCRPRTWPPSSRTCTRRCGCCAVTLIGTGVSLLRPPHRTAVGRRTAVEEATA